MNRPPSSPKKKKLTNYTQTSIFKFSSGLIVGIAISITILFAYKLKNFFL